MLLFVGFGGVLFVRVLLSFACFLFFPSISFQVSICSEYQLLCFLASLFWHLPGFHSLGFTALAARTVLSNAVRFFQR